MRLSVFIIALLVVQLALADSYTLYTPGTIKLQGANISATLYHPDDLVLDAAVSSLQAAKAANASNIANLTSIVRQDIAEAKTNDQVYLQTPWKNLFLDYKNCEATGPYQFCFTSVTYYEEDVDPLGDGHMHATKIINNTIVLPFVITVTPLKVTLSASRTVNPSQIFVGEKANVSTTVTNTGTQSASQVQLNELPPLPVIAGKTSSSIATLDAGDSLNVNYTVQPTAAGNYTLNGTAISNEAAATLAVKLLVVKQPLKANITIGSGYTNEPLAFTIMLSNVYNRNISVQSLSVDTDERISESIHGIGTPKPGQNLQSLNAFYLAPGANATITGALTPVRSVTHTLHVSILYAAATSTSLDVSALYTPVDRAFSATAQVNGSIATITLNNTLTTAVTSVVVDYGGGQVSRIPSLSTGGISTMQHIFPQSGEVNVTVTYTTNSPQVKILTLELGAAVQNATNNTVSNATAVPAANATNQSGQTANVTQPSQPSQPSGETPPTPPAPAKKSFLDRFLDWLSHIFG